MDYQRIYNEIINNRKQNTPDVYTEKHHIIPKSLGGSNNKDNIIRLTAREHFICHLLLIRIYKDDKYKWAKMMSAFCRMLQQPQEEQRRYCPSKWYAYLRENMSIAMSINQGGERNSQYGKHWIINPETKQVKSVYSNNIQTYLDSGWILGRTLNKVKRKTRSEEAARRKQLYETQKQIHGKKYQFTNVQTGEIKQFWLDEICRLDENWVSPFYILDTNKPDIANMLLNGYHIYEVAAKYNVSYDNFYTWYRKYGKDIRQQLKHK